MPILPILKNHYSVFKTNCIGKDKIKNMSSLIITFQTESNISFSKNVIANMKNGLAIPDYALQFLDKTRKAIYWKLFAKFMELPYYYDCGDYNLMVLKNMVKYCPSIIKEDYLGFLSQWKEDNGYEHTIDCPKIKCQIDKLFN